jgi:hypothetical protein
MILAGGVIVEVVVVLEAVFAVKVAVPVVHAE